MSDATDYAPVECPVSDCSYSDAVRSVAGHVSGTDDDAHSWSRLDYDGARDFVMTEKRRQRGELETGAGSDGPDSPDADDADFELGFERDALVLLELAHEYDLSSLDDLGVGQLADLYALLADLKNSADDARTQVRDKLQEEVREDGTISADFGSVNRHTREYRSLEDDATVRAALEDADVDPESVRSFDKGKLKDAVEETDLDDESVFDVEERPRIRIAGSNDDRRRERFDRLDPEIRSLVEDDD